jgi:hypothetical protein
VIDHLIERRYKTVKIFFVQKELVALVAKAVFATGALCYGNEIVIATCFFHVEEISATFSGAYALGKNALIFKTLATAAAKAATVTTAAITATVVAATETATVTTAAITATVVAATETATIAAAAITTTVVSATKTATITAAAKAATVTTAFTETTAVSTSAIAASVAVVTVPIVVVSPLKIPVFHLSKCLVKKMIFKNSPRFCADTLTGLARPGA